MDKIVIIGAGGHAKVIADIIEQSKQFYIAGMIDTFLEVGTKCGKYEVIGDESLLATREDLSKGIVAIGDNWIRRTVRNRIAELTPDFKFITAVHPKSIIADDVELGDGTVVMAGAIINPGTKIGEHCIINTGAILDHDNQIDDYCAILPGATIGGEVSIGEGSVVAIGATIIHGITIGKHTVVGAGATVVNDTDSNIVAIGTPARKVKQREAGDRYL